MIKSTKRLVEIMRYGIPCVKNHDPEGWARLDNVIRV
jgi:hypothetical protein